MLGLVHSCWNVPCTLGSRNVFLCGWISGPRQHGQHGCYAEWMSLTDLGMVSDDVVSFAISPAREYGLSSIVCDRRRISVEEDSCGAVQHVESDGQPHRGRLSPLRPWWD